MRISADITPADYRALRLYSLFHHRVLRVTFVVLFLFVARNAAISVEGAPLGQRVLFLLGSLVEWLFISALFGMVVFGVIKILPQPKSKIMGLHTFIVASDDITEENSGGVVTYTWPSVAKLAETKGHFFVIGVNESAMMIPKRAFKSPEEQARFSGLVKERIDV